MPVLCHTPKNYPQLLAVFFFWVPFRSWIYVWCLNCLLSPDSITWWRDGRQGTLGLYADEVYLLIIAGWIRIRMIRGTVTYVGMDDAVNMHMRLQTVLNTAHKFCGCMIAYWIHVQDFWAWRDFALPTLQIVFPIYAVYIHARGPSTPKWNLVQLSWIGPQRPRLCCLLLCYSFIQVGKAVGVGHWVGVACQWRWLTCVLVWVMSRGGQTPQVL